MPFQKGHQHSEAWYAAMSRPRPEHVKQAISAAQKGRTHQSHEGFQPGHAFFGGVATQFGKVPSWNKGKGKGRDPLLVNFRAYKSNAKKRGYEFGLTHDSFRVFLSSLCEYCGSPATGVDRIDNSRGYVEGNMAPCCRICNHMKHILSVEEFVAKCAAITAKHGTHIS